jgi:tRNA pseudouridine55 synthase
MPSSSAAPGPGAELAALLERGGVLVLDKPPGPTSADVVAVVRRALGHAKTGHTGTLDPSATGVLPVVVGRATRLAQYLTASEKEYLARIVLGRATDTYDAAGAVTSEVEVSAGSVTRELVTAGVERFRGRFPQMPPPYSAKKQGGVRAYERARKGLDTDLAAVDVELLAVDVLEVDGSAITVRMVTSPGFYVRSFAHDLGRILGTGGHLATLRRMRSGSFTVDAAVSLDTVVREGTGVLRHLIGIDSLLPGLPAVRLTAEGCLRVARGRDLGPESVEPDAGSWNARLVRLVSPDGSLLGLGEPGGDGALHPALVLV